MFRPLTDISKGAAQVFDTSPLVEQARARRLEKKADEEKLLASMVNLNPNGMFKNHLPGFQNAVKDYQQFVMNNAEALMNPSENIELYAKKMEMESQLKNIVAGSVNYNQEYNKALPMVMTNESYMNPENKGMMAGIDEYIPTADELRHATAFAPIISSLSRSITSDPTSLVDEATKELGTLKSDLDTDKYDLYDVITESRVYKDADIRDFVQKKLKMPGVTGEDWRQYFGQIAQEQEMSVEDAAVKYIKDGLIPQTQETIRQKPSEGGAGADSYQFNVTPGWNAMMTEQVASTEGGGTSEVQYDFVDAGDAVTFSPVRIPIQMTDLIDLSTNKKELSPSAVKEGIFAGKATVLRNTGNKPIKIGGQTIAPDGYLKNTWGESRPNDVAVAINDERRKGNLKLVEVAQVYGVTNPMEYLKYRNQGMSEEQALNLMIMEGSGGNWYITPLTDKLTPALNNAILKQSKGRVGINNLLTTQKPI